MRRILEAIEAGDGEAAYVASMEHVNVVSDLAQVALAGESKHSGGI
jgi:DNA-binding FadR family transcriptional regulator